MLDQTIRQTILTLREAGHGTRAIARALGISRGAVKAVLVDGNAAPPALVRAEKAEPHRDEILALLKRCKGNLVRVQCDWAHEKLLVPDGLFVADEDRLAFALHPVPTGADVVAIPDRIVRRLADEVREPAGDRGPAPAPRDRADVLSAVWAGAVHTLYGYLDWLARQLFGDTAEREQLLRKAALYGITPVPATFATAAVSARHTDLGDCRGAARRRGRGRPPRLARAAAVALVSLVAVGPAPGQSCTRRRPIASARRSARRRPRRSARRPPRRSARRRATGPAR